MARRPFFYGYVIVAICFFNMVLMRGILASFSVFNIAFLDTFQWSRAATASIASVNGLVYSFASPLVGWAYDRLGPRILMPLGCAAIGVGLLLSGASTSWWHLCLFYGVFVGLGVGCIGFVSNTALLSQWFRRRRATAMGFATMGLGAGILLVPGVQVLIERFGWRAAMVLLGATVLVTLVPLNAVFQRGRPEDIGQLPDGELTGAADDAPRPGEARREGPAPRHDWTLREAFASFPFWAIAVGHLALGIGLSLMYTHAVAHLVHVGLDDLAAASAFSMVGLARIPGTAVWGLASDRLGRDQAYGVATLVTLAGLGVLMALSAEAPAWWFVAFAVLYGVGHSGGNPTFGSTITDIFSGKDVGKILGWLEITFGIGVAFGPWFGGYAYDVAGSYQTAWIVGMASFAMTYVSIRASMTWQRRVHPETR
ncbi:MAG: MFS transporter [Deltaproteobacteria bacterium]|nr:MFS transporter [Deltaproteobacteria bacterium]